MYVIRLCPLIKYIIIKWDLIVSIVQEEETAYSTSSIFPLHANTLHKKYILPDQLKLLITRGNIQYNINITYYSYCYNLLSS